MRAELEYKSSGKKEPVLVLSRSDHARRVVIELPVTAEQARAIEVGIM
jgi:hypothetical protein